MSRRKRDSRQLGIFDPPPPPRLTPAQEARDAAVDQVEKSNAQWIDLHALPAIRAVLEVRHFFTTDHVWPHVGVEPSERRAMGAAMRAAHREGLIEPTHAHQISVRVEAHANPKRVWCRAFGGIAVHNDAAGPLPAQHNHHYPHLDRSAPTPGTPRPGRLTSGQRHGYRRLAFLTGLFWGVGR